MDYFSLKTAVGESKKRFEGRKVREAGQSSFESAALSFGKEDNVLLSIAPSRPGLFILQEKPSFEGISSPFAEILAARIRGSTLASIFMPESGERIVFFNFRSGWPEKAGEEVSLVLEVMGRHSNLALLEEGRIVQPLKSVPAEKSPRRPFLPGTRWEPPPPRPGIPPEKIKAADLLEMHDPSNPDAAETLVRIVKGLSPFTAKQVLLRAGGGEPPAIAHAIRDMLHSADGKDGWLFSPRTGSKVRLCPFEPLLREEKEGTVKSFEPFSAASSAWLDTDPAGPGKPLDENTRLAEDLGRIEKRLQSILSLLDAEKARCQDHEEVRRKAQALLISASRIGQGTPSASLPDPIEPEKMLTIDLDPSISPARNADRLFNVARRLKRGLEGVSKRRIDMEKKLGIVVAAREALLEREDPGPALALFQSGSQTLPKDRETSFKAYKGPGRKHTFGGFTILVGKNAADNERVTFQAARPEDLWLHARDYPGSHVVIISQKKKVPEAVVRHAASLAVENSGARKDTAPEIMVAERKWVRKLKGAAPGKVTVQRFRTIRVRKNDAGKKSQG